MLQQEQPEDFVIATGEQHSVREFVDIAAAKWRCGSLEGRRAWTKRATTTGQLIVAVDPRYFRPTEVETLLGNPAKAKAKLGWTPKTSFDELVTEMVIADYELAKRDALVRTEGYKILDHHE